MIQGRSQLCSASQRTRRHPKQYSLIQGTYPSLGISHQNHIGVRRQLPGQRPGTRVEAADVEILRGVDKDEKSQGRESIAGRGSRLPMAAGGK